MKKLIILFCALPSLIFGQDEQEGEIVSKVPFGELYYYYVKENNSENYYKTNAVQNSNLNYGQVVKINLNPNSEDFYELSEPNSSQKFLSKKINSNNNSNLNQPSIDLILRLPYVKEDMLFFSNWKQYNEVYSLIENYIDEVKIQNGSEFGLNTIESYLRNYTSFREHYNTVFDSEINSYTSEDVDKVEKKDVVKCEILKILLNKNRLICIEDKVYYYYDFDVLIAYDIKSFFLKNQGESKLDQIKKINRTWEDLNSETPRLPGYLICGKDVFVNSTSVFVSNTKGTYQFDDQSPKYETVLGFINVTCSGYEKKIYVDTYRYKWLPAQLDANGNVIAPAQLSNTANLDNIDSDNALLMINWGDGTSNQFVNNYANDFISHTYTSLGTFTVTTTLYYFSDEGQSIILTDNIAIPINGKECSAKNREKYGAVQSGDSNGDWKLAANLWALSNELREEVGGYTHGWKKVSGSWKRKSSRIFVDVNGTFRDSDCSIAEHKQEDDVENQERVDAEKFKLKKYWSQTNGDVHSQHRLTKGSTILEIFLELIFC